MPKISGDSSGDGVQAVVLALHIMEYLAEQRRPVGVTALAEALGTTKSRIFRHLRTLVQHGYIVQSPESERYQVGSQLVQLGRLVGENLDLAAAAHPILRELRDELGHSTVVSQVEAEGVRVLARVPGTSPIEIGVKPGSLLPFHSSAQGKIALAFGEEALRTRVFRSRLEMLTPSTITAPGALEEEIERTRQRGWAIAPNEAMIGINTLAAPVFDVSGALVGAVGVVDSIQFIPAEASDEQIRRTVAAARRISKHLGFRE
jgi:IclR family KDG regulon transcriptional repressor